MLACVSNFKSYIWSLFMTTNILHDSTLLSFNLSMFTKEDGTIMKTSLVTFTELWEKFAFLKIATQAFEAGDCL